MADKFDTMVAMLELDPQLAAQFGKSPDTVLAQFGVTAAQLNTGTKQSAAALARANAVLTAAALGPKDTAVTAMKKVSQQADKAFKDGYNVKVGPIGVVYSERVNLKRLLDILTGIATVTCTFSPHDGCHGDANG